MAAAAVDAHAFDPVDVVVLLFAGDDERGLVREGEQAVGIGGEDSGEVGVALVRGAGEVVEAVDEADERGLERALELGEAGGVLPVEAGAPVAAEFGLRRQQLAEEGEESLRGGGNGVGVARKLLAVSLEAAENAVELGQRELGTEGFGGDRFEVVGLVEHEPSVGRQDAAAGRGGLGQDERVVDDHEVRLGGVLARLLDEAASVVRTPAPGAFVAGPREERAVDAVVGVEVAVGRGREPLDEARQESLLVVGHRPVAGREEIRHGLETDIVGAPLEQGDLEGGCVIAEHRDGPGDVGVDELSLQVAGGGGDHDRGVVLPGPEDGRHQVGKGLADAGARLDHQVLAGVERGGDGAAHVDLSGALLVAVARAQGSAGAEVRLRRLHVERRAVLVRGQMARRPRRAARRDHGFPGRVRYESSGIHCWAYYTIFVVRDSWLVVRGSCHGYGIIRAWAMERTGWSGRGSRRRRSARR